MTREDPDASTSDDSDIEIQLPIAVKRNRSDMPESTETTQKRIAAVEKKKSEEEQEQREEAGGDAEKEALHKTIRDRLSKKSGYKPDLS